MSAGNHQKSQADLNRAAAAARGSDVDFVPRVNDGDAERLEMPNVR
jgi:hypothetical protein